MSWILYRDLFEHETVLFETDDRSAAARSLEGIAINPISQLIDFSGDLDGALDNILAGVKLFPATETAKVA
jgi:hypothetical protein